MEGLAVASSCSGMELCPPRWRLQQFLIFGRQRCQPTFPPVGLSRRAPSITRLLSPFPCKTPAVMTKKQSGDDFQRALPGWAIVPGALPLPGELREGRAHLELLEGDNKRSFSPLDSARSAQENSSGVTLGVTGPAPCFSQQPGLSTVQGPVFLPALRAA